MKTLSTIIEVTYTENGTTYTENEIVHNVADLANITGATNITIIQEGDNAEEVKAALNPTPKAAPKFNRYQKMVAKYTALDLASYNEMERLEGMEEWRDEFFTYNHYKKALQASKDAQEKAWVGLVKAAQNLTEEQWDAATPRNADYIYSEYLNG